MTHQAPCPQQRGSFHGFPTKDTGMAKMSFFAYLDLEFITFPGQKRGQDGDLSVALGVLASLSI